MNDTHAQALRFHAAGISFVPILPDGSKRPSCPWKEFQRRLPTADELAKLFTNDLGIGIAAIAGQVSGNLEMLDFDDPDTFHRWRDVIAATNPFLLSRLVIIQTPGPGYQVWYRSDLPVGGNRILARRPIPSAERTPRLQTLIETRGEGGYAVAPGSPAAVHRANRPYVAQQGDPASPPVLSPADRDTLLDCARALNEYVEPEQWQQPPPPPGRGAAGTRPGDDYNARGDVLALLLKHGWTVERHSGDVLYLCRPGKTEPGPSATLGRIGPGGLYVFSTNAAPFAAPRGYTPFTVYALLEHGGDIAAAARALGAQGYGEPARPARDDPPHPAGTADAVHAATRRENDARRRLEALEHDHPPAARDPPTPYSAAHLQTETLPPLEWIVEKLIMVGATLLIGHSKLGKSFWSLGIAVAVATGGRALGALSVTPGDVLYIALEDGKRRVKRRLHGLLEGETVWPANLFIVHEWPTLDAAGRTSLDTYLAAHPGIRLVILDTWNGLRPSHAKGGDLVKEDYEAVASLRKIGETHACAIVIVHHAAQATKADWVNSGASTHGMPAAADSVLVLQRHRGDHNAVLLPAGKDMESEEPMQLERDTRNGFWSLAATGAQVYESGPRRRIRETIEQNIAREGSRDAGAMKPVDVARTLGRLQTNERGTIRQTMKRMAIDGELTLLDDGLYTLPLPH